MGDSIFVGVDGGGTHTVALVGDRSGRIVGRGQAGPSNPQAVGFDASADEIVRAIRAALFSQPDSGIGGAVSPGHLEQSEGSPGRPEMLPFARRDRDDAVEQGQADPGRGRRPMASRQIVGQSGHPDMIRRAVLGIAGCGRPADRARLAGLVAERLGSADGVVRVVTDVALLLPAAGLATGVALVAGTGSSAFGQAADGRTASAGGWGYLLGDDGSAFDVGRRALRAVLRADDGCGPPTRLIAALKDGLQVAQPRDLIRVVYQSPSPRSTIADLAPLVVATARDGDAVAQQIVSRAGEVLGHLASAVKRRLDLDPSATVIGTGGVLQAGDLILTPLRRALAHDGLTDFRLLDAEPSLGALRLAITDATSRSQGARQ